MIDLEKDASSTMVFVALLILSSFRRAQAFRSHLYRLDSVMALVNRYLLNIFEELHFWLDFVVRLVEAQSGFTGQFRGIADFIGVV